MLNAIKRSISNLAARFRPSKQTREPEPNQATSSPPSETNYVREHDTNVLETCEQDIRDHRQDSEATAKIQALKNNPSLDSSPPPFIAQKYNQIQGCFRKINVYLATNIQRLQEDISTTTDEFCTDRETHNEQYEYNVAETDKAFDRKIERLKAQNVARIQSHNRQATVNERRHSETHKNRVERDRSAGLSDNDQVLKSKSKYIYVAYLLTLLELPLTYYALLYWGMSTLHTAISTLFLALIYMLLGHYAGMFLKRRNDDPILKISGIALLLLGIVMAFIFGKVRFDYVVKVLGMPPSSALLLMMIAASLLLFLSSVAIVYSAVLAKRPGRSRHNMELAQEKAYLEEMDQHHLAADNEQLRLQDDLNSLDEERKRAQEANRERYHKFKKVIGIMKKRIEELEAFQGTVARRYYEGAIECILAYASTNIAERPDRLVPKCLERDQVLSIVKASDFDLGDDPEFPHLEMAA